MTDTIPISGLCPDTFASVKDAFAQNFKDDLECGAGFALIKDGDVIIDLVGGYTNRKQDTPWSHETLIPVFSSTKAVSAIVIAHLADQDRLGYNQKVASLWPEFAAHGKDELTIAQVLSHQAGLPGITSPDWTPQDWFDVPKTCARLAAQNPLWKPGTACGYHPSTVGYLAGEIARRADKGGRSLGQILRQDICAPNAIDFFIGTPASEHGRCADLIKPRQLPDLGEMNFATKAAFMEKWSAAGGMGITAWRELESPAANGHGTAKALAQIIDVIQMGNIGGQKYLSEDMLYAIAQPRISGPNLVLPFDLTFAAGLMKNPPNFFYGPNESTLGHSGWGGSCVFADPGQGISAAYVMNKQSHHLLGDPRPLRIIEAVYKCLTP